MYCYIPIASPVAVCRDDSIRLQLSRAARHDRPFAQIYEWHGAVLRGSACLATFANRPVQR
jgi:hypothetical protein